MMAKKIILRTLELALVCGVITGMGGCVVTPGYYPAASPVSTPFYIHTPPPEPLVEFPGVAPAAGFFWMSGFWDWNGVRYVWRPGRWEHHRAGYQWEPHRWEREGNHWKLNGGHWREK